MRGSHELLSFPSMSFDPMLSAEAYAISRAVCEPPDCYSVFHVATSLGQDQLSELNELGTAPAPVCTRCAGCMDCTFRRKWLSPEDQEIVSRIESEMTIDDSTGIISGKYPWKPCVERMTSNAAQALKIQQSIERHMIKAGTIHDYQMEMEKAISEEKVRLLTEAEMSVWHGPVHYVTIFAVVKPDSLSTHTRIVSNSALRNSNTKLSLNDCMSGGPNALADLLNCLLFWHGVAVAVMMDLRKAYQAIHTSSTELHLRRFYYRSRSEDNWDTYAYTRATFGDLTAGLLLEIAKHKVANLGEELDPLAAKQLKEFFYIDDGILGGSCEEVERMRGDQVDGTYTGTAARILAQGGMSVKFMAVTGLSDAFEEEQLGGKNLGVVYDIRQDEIVLSL